MKTQQTLQHAVLTGDIVDSSRFRAPERRALFESFPKLSAMLRARYPDDVQYNISNYRGDGWQLVVNNPARSLEISILIRTYLSFAVSARKVDSRITIGVGAVDLVPAENVSAGYGAAYTVSGHLLEELPPNQRMALGFAADSLSPAHSTPPMLVELLDALISGWGASQCQAVYWALQGYNQKQIAARWLPRPITQPSVSSSLNRSAWSAVRNSLTYFEQVMVTL